VNYDSQLNVVEDYLEAIQILMQIILKTFLTPKQKLVAIVFSCTNIPRHKITV
jgi:hypothetical protein